MVSLFSLKKKEGETLDSVSTLCQLPSLVGGSPPHPSKPDEPLLVAVDGPRKIGPKPPDQSL